MNQDQVTRDQAELDREEASRNVYGPRSLLDASLCQMCGSEPGTGGTVPWYDENEVRHEDLYTWCNEETP